METLRVVCAGAVLAAASSAPLGAAGLVLVVDGKPNAVIIAADEPHARRAAAEIQKYLEKISGAKLPLQKEGDADTTGLPVRIAVGHTQLAAAAGVAIPSGFNEVVGDPNVFEEEAFVIKTVGNTVYVGGNSDGPYQGTLYAGYEFLERLGCRFYFPGEWGEVVPETKTVTFPETDLKTRPDFALRNVNLGGWFPSSPAEQKTYEEWCGKIKFTTKAFYPLVGDGFLGYLLPPKEYPNEPDLYAMNKAGSRKQPESFLNGVMLSLVNPRTYELSVQNLREALGGETKSAIKRIISPNGFGISPPDGAAYDYDPKAVEKNQNFDYPTYVQHPMTSEEYYAFAARLAREFPGKWVATMAYSGREMPPQGVEIPPNLTVLYAPISSCVLHAGDDPACWRRVETIQIMRQWCKLTPHVYLYDYNPGFLLGSFVPERDVANFAVNVKLYKDMKLKGMQAEGRKAFMITWISNYVRAKLLWDANADVEAIKRDFYANFFGPEAGPFVQQWWDECEKALGAAANHCHEDWLIDHVYTVAFTTRIHEFVEKARRCAMTPKQKERFEAFALIADHLEAFAARNEAEKVLDYAEAARQARRMEEDNAKLIAMYSFFIGPKKHPDFNNGWLARYEELLAMTNGEKGTMVAPVPLEAKFRRDRYNEGVVMQWYLPGHDDADWGRKNTFNTWDAQDPPEDAKGHDYDGYGWYRFTVDIRADAAAKPARLHLGGVINEAWVWVNGEYAGHRPWLLWWAGRKPLEMSVDVTGKLKPGRNDVAVRVWNSAEVGGLLRRGFVWAPKP